MKKTGSIPDMEALEILGGRICLDFVNTCNWGAEGVMDDRLRSLADLFSWGKKVGLIREKGVPQVTGEEEATRLLEEIRQFRLVIRRLCCTDTPLPDDLAVVTAKLGKGQGLALSSDTAGMFLDTENPDLTWLEVPVAFSVVELLSSPLRNRVKICPGERCGWLFLDASPNNRRRWCSMAICGNRHKAKEHYGRRKKKTP